MKVGARVPASRVLLVSSFGAFLAFLDATIVNVAFPSIKESFPGESIGGLSWVLNAYNITFAAFLIVCGRLTDLVGRRRAFVAGVLVFTAASVLCGLAPSVALLVVARVVQALGAALLVPASLALVVDAFAEDRRAHAIGLWGATAAVAAGLGPPLGGVLVEVGSWRWAFLVNLPFGAAALLAARSQLVESRAPGRRTLPDMRGAGLLAGALGVLNLAIIQGHAWGWGSGEILGSFGASAVLFAFFVLSSRAHRSPLLDPALLRIPSFSVASLATVLAGLGFFAYLLTNILWLQYVWRYDVLLAGLALVPGALVAAVVAAVLGPLADRHGYRLFVVPGALVWAGAYVWYHRQTGLSADFVGEWLPGQILSGIGVGATLPLLGSAALAAVPGGRYATASAVVSSARQLGGVLGIALLVVIVGNPTPVTAVTSFRHGWVLSIGAFLAVAVVSLFLGKLSTRDEEASDTERPLARIQLPTRPPIRVPASGLSIDNPANLSSVPMMAALPEQARRRLERSTRVRVIPAGDWLLREGDPPGSAYVVRRGRLEVFVGGRSVRELGPDDVLGEISLLTGENRSASVRALRDTSVLDIPRSEFTDLLASDVSASRAVLAQVAGRLRTAGGPTSPAQAAQPTVIAVVGLHRDVETSPVASALVSRLAVYHSVLSSTGMTADGLDRAEGDHDRVVLVAEDRSGQEGWRDFCLRQADVVVLVARSDQDVPTAPLAPAPSRRPEVVLVGDEPGPGQLGGWRAWADAWQLTVVGRDLPDGVRSLGDRLAGRSLGLVLGGGGARAFAHIGVLRELADAGLHVDRVAGTSVGALIAAVHASGHDGQSLEEVCYAELVRRRPFSDWRFPTRSLARGARITDGLARTFHDTVLEGLPRQLATVSTDLVTRTRQVHRHGAVVGAVQASLNLPVLFPPIADDAGRLLIDGGVLDNLPVDLLTERDEGPVVAVNISMGGGNGLPRTGHPTRRLPRVPALGETLLRTMTIGSGGAVSAALARGAWVVTPPTLGVGLLEFHQFDRMVVAGREAARMLLDQAGGDLGAPAEGPLDGVPSRTPVSGQVSVS